MMNRVVFLWRALLFMGVIWGTASCSKEPFSIYPDPGPDTIYQEADILVITQHQLYLLEHVDYSIYHHMSFEKNDYACTFFHIVYSTNGILNLQHPTYIWAEALDKPIETIVDGKRDESGYTIILDGGIGWNGYSLSDTVFVTDGAMIGFEGKIPDDYRFVLKFYQPHSQTYYQTRPLTLHFEEPEGEPLVDTYYTEYNSYAHITRL